MLGYIGVVKQKVKAGITKEYFVLMKTFNIANIKSARRWEVVEVDEHNFILIFECDDISSVIEAQEILVSQLDQIRHLLVEIDDEGNVTDLASGTLINREAAGG